MDSYERKETFAEKPVLFHVQFILQWPVTSLQVGEQGNERDGGRHKIMRGLKKNCVFFICTLALELGVVMFSKFSPHP